MSDRLVCSFWVFLPNILVFLAVLGYSWLFLAIFSFVTLANLFPASGRRVGSGEAGTRRRGTVWGGRCGAWTEVKASFRPTLRVSRGPFVVRALRGKAVNASFPPLHRPRDRLSSSCVWNEGQSNSDFPISGNYEASKWKLSSRKRCKFRWPSLSGC